MRSLQHCDKLLNLFNVFMTCMLRQNLYYEIYVLDIVIKQYKIQKNLPVSHLNVIRKVNTAMVLIKRRKPLLDENITYPKIINKSGFLAYDF